MGRRRTRSPNKTGEVLGRLGGEEIAAALGASAVPVVEEFVEPVVESAAEESEHPENLPVESPTELPPPITKAVCPLPEERRAAPRQAGAEVKDDRPVATRSLFSRRLG